jgi:hypothetical protein
MTDPREAAIREDEQRRFGGAIEPRQTIVAEPGPKRYLLTSAQNNTHVHAAFWRNLLAYARHTRARLLVSQFTYNKASYGERSVKPGSKHSEDYDDVWYAPEIEPHAFNDRLAIAPSLTFCGEINISPTAVRPLSGFENYTGRSSGIFPHVKHAMQSIASPHAAKFNYTTGACTLRNYLQKKAGLKAERTHVYGALIVEVDLDGDWFVRQIQAREDGAFQDLDVFVDKGRVQVGRRVEAVQWGDVHVEQLDPAVRLAQWGKGRMLDRLRPKYQFLHDTLDFKSRNHHDSRDPHEMFRKFVRKQDSVRDELQRVATFLAIESARSFCTSVVVESNHDKALTRWLRESEFRVDPQNAEFFLDAQRVVYAALRAGEPPRLFEHVMRQMGVPRTVRFLGTGESFVTCKASGGIENGLHGHAGPNGSRGAPAQFARLGRPTNTGHTHSAGIVDGAFTAGVSGRLRMGYNDDGPSSWSHSAIVTYAYGGRAIVTIWSGKWRGRFGKTPV